MASTELEVLKILEEYKGKARIKNIADELRISSGYAVLICEGLQRRGFATVSRGYCFFQKKKREDESLEIERAEVSKAKKRRVVKPRGIPLTNLKGVTKEIEKLLQKAGYKNIEAIAEAPVSRLMETLNIELSQAAQMINEARMKLKRIGIK